MLVTCLKTAICFGALLLSASPVLPLQIHGLLAATPPEPLKVREVPILDELRFTGLRRIAPAAVAAQLKSREGAPFDAANIGKDLRALATLGWFESIQVEEGSSTLLSPQALENQQHIALTFHLEERPFLTKVEYSGSRRLSQKQIDKMLEDKKLVAGLGRPADPAALQRIAFVIRSGLNELGHPDASVNIRREEAKNATVSVRFEINDGPLLQVRQVNFVGNPQLSPKVLRGQMRNIAPWKPLASWRGKDAYTREAMEEDSARILAYYQNHGYPEARIGNPRVERIKESSRRWFPWPHGVTQSGLSVSIPVQAGNLFRFESIGASPALEQAAEGLSGKPVAIFNAQDGRPYSSQVIENLRRSWLARVQPQNPKDNAVSFRAVESMSAFDADKHTVHVTYDLSDSQPYVVRRIEFQGLHKFSDRFMRRRIVLREGQPVNDRALEAGLLRLARTGYFKPIHKEDIHVQMDDVTHTANVSIQVKEIGQQRASLVGGNGQFGSTLGIIYTVFDLLNREELFSSQLEGGPESLQIMVGLAKEGIFGTRASLAFSVFNNVIRPRFARGAQGPFFSSRSQGIAIPWTYPLNNTDSLAINYTLARTTTAYPSASLVAVPGVTLGDIRSKTSSSSLGVGWARDTGSERVAFSNSVSGGWLGGSENMVRSSAEYSRIFRDPLFSPKGAWAFRTTFIGAGSYRGDMPFYARIFSGDELVRGLRPGEFGPYAVTASTAANGATIYSASPAGANLLTAVNAEYRFPLGGGTEAVGFFDLGSGLLLPNWLGPTKPLLLGATNGVLHGSLGIELRWTIPGVQVPVRVYYAVNVLRMNRFFSLSHNSLFRAHNRFSAFGWGLGSLF
jgi:outer membrane protein assembly complex protein YaeT